MNRELKNKIIHLIEPVLADIGFCCLDVSWVSASKALQVFIEDLSGATDIDSCVKATRALNEISALDEMIDGAYNLEVSTPGLERPLRLKEHFERALGSKLKVKLIKPFNEQKAGTGSLGAVAADSKGETMITLETSRGEWSFPIELVDEANLVYDWNQDSAR